MTWADQLIREGEQKGEQKGVDKARGEALAHQRALMQRLFRDELDRWHERLLLVGSVDEVFNDGPASR